MKEKSDLRVVKTYHLLHQAFTNLLQEKTFDQITVNELCEKAMIRRTTFYKHFADKYQYFTHYIKELQEKIMEPIPVDGYLTDINGYIIATCHALFSFISENKKLVDHIVKTGMDPLLFQFVEKKFEEQIGKVIGAYPEQAPPVHQQLLVSFYTGGLLNILTWWIKNPNILNEQQLTEQISYMLNLHMSALKNS